jgi:hypothetical protein
MPEAEYQVSEVLTRTVEADPSAHISTATQVAVEMWMTTGPRTLYGLLGARWTPADSGGLVIRVATSLQPAPEPMNTNVKEVSNGLPPEFALPVLEEASSFSGTRSLGAGMLTFDHARFSSVGSAPAFFRILARSVIKLLSLSSREVNDAELISLIDPGKLG